MKIKILALYADRNDATSLYRGVGPMSKIHKSYLAGRLNYDIEVFEEQKFTWATISRADIAFIQRPFGRTFLDGIRILKENRIPVWVDYDDILFAEDIPDYNPARYAYSNPAETPSYPEILKLADVITVTTQALYDRLSEYNKNIVIIPNAMDDYRFTFEKAQSMRGIINWRGSGTHSKDLLEAEKSLLKVQESNPEWIFNFIGSDADKLTELKCQKVPPMDPIKYFRSIKEIINPRIQIVPLVDNFFNRCKSNIGWIEGVYSGAVGVAPRYLPEFVRPGCVNYDTPDEFVEVLNRVIKDIPFAKECYEKSFDFIEQNLLLSKTNNKRVEVIESLL